MIAELVDGSDSLKYFSKLQQELYRGNPYYRGTESSIEHLLLFSDSAFHNHATIRKFILRDGNDCVARFALIHDHHLPDWCQISFFEALPGLGNILPLIIAEVRRWFPNCRKVVAGLNGHLNYGAGFLLNQYDMPPLFGLNYTPDYYPEYFKPMQQRRLFTFRYELEHYLNWANQFHQERNISRLNLRFMNKKNIEQEVKIYTLLNNLSFGKHPYWAKREEEDDLELFKPFRHLLDNENLIFAYAGDEPIGFFLWYPDFNQLVNDHRDLGLMELLKFRLFNKIDTMRYTEIGIIPQYQGSRLYIDLMRKSHEHVMKNGYRYCEAGFVFEDNAMSMAMTRRIYYRIYQKELMPYRVYATYDMDL
jgi:hypothetical protein